MLCPGIGCVLATPLRLGGVIARRPSRLVWTLNNVYCLSHSSLLKRCRVPLKCPENFNGHPVGPLRIFVVLSMWSMWSTWPVLLCLYNPEVPTKVSADASSHGLEAILQQSDSAWRAVTYAYRATTPFLNFCKECSCFGWASFQEGSLFHNLDLAPPCILKIGLFPLVHPLWYLNYLSLPLEAPLPPIWGQPVLTSIRIHLLFTFSFAVSWSCCWFTAGVCRVFFMAFSKVSSWFICSFCDIAEMCMPTTSLYCATSWLSGLHTRKYEVA